MKKTNAMRILDSKKIPYNSYEYEIVDGKTDGLTVARTVGKDPDRVFKTLVTQGASKAYYVFVVPVKEELDLKKAASAAGEKKIEMIPMKDLLMTTGYIHGGCSPVGMKKQFPTFMDESASNHEQILVSGGRIGVQIEVNVVELVQLIDARLIPLSATV